MLMTLIKAVMAGVAVSLGGITYLSIDNKFIGAFLFSIGLFSIYTFSLNLYTGKICHIPNKKPRYLIEVLIVYLGNFIGTMGIGYLIRYTKLSNLIYKAQEVSLAKLSDTLFSTFIMSIFCGILMCVAVIGFATIKDEIGKYLAITLPIMVFILAGFEHSIANLFYFSFANMWSGKSILYSFVMAFGNLIGGIILPLVSRLDKRYEIRFNTQIESDISLVNDNIKILSK